LLADGGQDEYLAFLKQTYRERAAALSGAIRRHFPTLDFREPQGGYFVWLELPEEVDTEQLLAVARQHQTGFQPGVKFSPDGAARNYLRLSFSFYETAVLAEGIARLQQALKSQSALFS
jgi:DNA-binding transcriptional MocR family regulator